jgi:signal peptidase II
LSAFAPIRRRTLALIATGSKFLGGEMRINIKLFFLFLILVSADQIIKIISSFFVCNKNIAWSLPIAPAIFYFVWTAIIFFLICIFLKTKLASQKYFIIFILSGAISNIIDRIRFGCVVDYIDLKIFPVFNLADIYITLGIIFLVAINLKKYKIPDTKY